MTSAIHDVPTDKNYGLGFNYSVWTQGTAITLANVPWNSDYRDIVRFDNQAALDNYINRQSGPVIDITRLSYAKFGRPIRLDTPFHTVQNFNYIRVVNPAQPIIGDTGRAFYYFIVDVEYVAPNTTHIYVQLDVWQTFGYGVKFGNCYIQQGHYGIANQNSSDNFGRNFLTQPEGLEIGNEYEIHKIYKHHIASADDEGGYEYEILVASTTALDVDHGTVDAPKLTSAKGSRMENLPNGTEMYLFNDINHFKQFMEMMADKPWATAGIISIQAVPPLGRYGISTTAKSVSGVAVAEVNGGTLMRPMTTMSNNFRGDVVLPERYRNLGKFYTYPYMVLEMTTNTGQPLILKPECLQTAELRIVEVPHFAPPNSRLAFYPYRYNAAGNSQPDITSKGVVHDGAEFLDMATTISNFPAFSIVNNGYMQFMAQNSNSLAFQHSSAEWSQQRALAGNANSYDQATAGINASADITRQGISAATSQTNLANETQASHTMLNGVGGIARGAIGGAAAGIGSAVMGGMSAAIDMNARNQGLGISNTLASGVNQTQNNTAAYMRDTNKSLSDWSANGDYQNQIAGINARVQDAKLTQPTTAGQVGGDAFLLSQYRWGVDVKIKILTPGFMNSIGEYWLRYGYAINRFGKMPESFMVMEKFTYWKLKETYITSSSCPESFKQVIRGIFEKGVTVWKNPADIGNIDIADNAPLEGVAL